MQIIVLSSLTQLLYNSLIFSGIASQGNALKALIGNFKNTSAMASSLTAIQQVSNAAFASGTSSLSGYALALNGVSDSQAALILKSQGLTANFAKQILMERGATETDAELALTRVGLIATTKELSATQVQQALVNTALTVKQKKQIVQALGLTIAQKGEIASTKLLTAEQIKHALATQGIVGADAEVIAMKMGLTVAEGTATVGVSALTKAIIIQTGAIITWLATNPVGWAILLASALAGTALLVDAFTVSLEEQQKKTEKLQEDYDKVAQNLSDVNSELETANSRMNELNSKDNLSFIEEEELQKLKDTTFELERQNALLTEQENLKKAKVAESITLEFDKEYNTGTLEFGFDTKSDAINNWLSTYKTYQNSLTDIEDKIRDIESKGGKPSQALLTSYESYKYLVEDSRKFLVDAGVDIQDYIKRYGVDDEISQSWENLFETIDKTLNPDVYKTKSFDNIINVDGNVKAVEKLKQMASDGSLTADSFKESFFNLSKQFEYSGLSAEEVVQQFYSLVQAENELENANGDTSDSAVTLDETLTSVSDNLDILSAVQRDLVEDGHLSVDTMQKLIEAGLDYNTIVGSSGETLREFILAEIDAEIATTNLALSVAEANVEMLKTMGIGGDALAPFIAQVDNLKSKVDGLENVKDITINTQYTKTSSTSSTKSEVPEQIQSFKTLEAEYQHLVNVKKMSEEDFMAWYTTAYKEAYKGYENSEEYASDYRSAMEKVFTWEEDRQKDLFDKRIQSINNEIDLVIKTKTDFSGNELETKEYFRQLKDLYTQQIDETNLRINEVLEQGVIGNGEYLEELEKQKIEYTQKIEDLNKEAFESEKEYIESIKDAELKAIDDRIDKVKEEQKAKEEAYQKEIDAIQDKIDTMNDANDEQEKANDLKQAGLDLEQAKLDLEKARNSYSKKVINSSGEVEYKTDNNAIAEAEKKFKDAEDKVAKLTIQARMDALEKQKEEQEQLQDKSNTDYDNQIKAIEEEKKTREQFYIDCIEKLDKLIEPDKQTESNSDTWEEVAKTDTTVSTDNGVTTVDSKEIPSSQATQPEQKQTFSPTTVNDYFKSMGINIPNVSDMVNMFPDITKSLFDNMLGNTSSSIANTSSIVNNDGGVVNTITVGDIVISNPVGNINDLSKELKTQLPSAIKKILAQ